MRTFLLNFNLQNKSYCEYKKFILPFIPRIFQNRKTGVFECFFVKNVQYFAFRSGYSVPLGGACYIHLTKEANENIKTVIIGIFKSVAKNG